MFSGCGGMDLGFKQAGYKIVWANDNDKNAISTYQVNLGEIDDRSITDISSNEVPDGDIVVGGFPCQPFSNAGNRDGVEDHRGNLFFDCLRIIREKKPKAFVLENVKGLLSSYTKHGLPIIEFIKSELSNVSKDFGYNTTYKLLNASDYGVPQNRQRVFIVGIRNDLNKQFIFPDAIPKNNLELKWVIGLPRGSKNNEHWELSPQQKEMIPYIKEGGSWKDIPYDLLTIRFRKIRDDMKKYHSPNFYRRFSRNEIVGTITASAQPENCGIIHPTENRRFTIREIARIQTFPEDFEFISSSITGMYKMIGNAVPPTMAKLIATQLKGILLEGKIRKSSKLRQLELF